MALRVLMSSSPTSTGSTQRSQEASRSGSFQQATCAKLFNYLDREVPAASRVVPEVASSRPRISDEGKTYVFTIRKGFRFSPPSNAPVTAETFKYSIERMLDKRMRSYYVLAAYVWDSIVGAKAFAAGKARHISGIVARGDVLTIRLTRPDPALPRS